MKCFRSEKGFLKGRLVLIVALALFLGIMPAMVQAEQKAQAKEPAAKAAPAAAEAPAPAAEAPAAPVIKGNAEIGKALFTGEKSLQNNGPACISCHNIGIGTLGGGSLGPDLTKIATNETKFSLVSDGWINGGGSPVMGPIFGARNITPEEVEHIKAFFSAQASQPIVSQGGMFVGGGIIGFIVILIIFNIIWSNRYRNRNRGTAHDALWRNYGGKGGR